MIWQVLKSTYRYILKDKVSFAINLANMVVGFTAFILLGLIVYNEFNWDRYQENFDRIYRVQTRQEDSEVTNYCTYSPSAIRYRVMEDIPEVEQVLLMRETGGLFFAKSNGEQVFDKLGYFAESSIFNIFTYNFLQGSKTNALSEPYTIVLSKEVADKIFPGESALGKEVIINKKFALRVDGVYENLPFNSAVRPEYLISMRTFEVTSNRSNYRDDWNAIDNDNFVLLHEGTDYHQVNRKIEKTFAHIQNMEKATPYLHPISEWHVSPNSQMDMIIALTVLGLAAVLVLILSCVNFVNLSLATSTRRALEIGIKKVVGYSKQAVAFQFLTETLFITLIAALIGLEVAQMTIPVMNNIVNTHLVIGVFDNLLIPLCIIGVALFAGLLAGMYPAFVVASFNPAKVLKGKIFISVTRKTDLRKVLVVTQYSISLFMLIVSLIIYNHVNFLIKKNMGFDKDNIVFAEVNITNPISFESIKERLLQHPEIVDATFSSTIPFNGNIGGYVSWEGAMPGQFEMISRNYVNYDFIPTYNMEMVKGRNFSREFPTDNQGCIINETALRNFGWDDPIGKKIDLYGRKYPVIGVVKDFHAFSVHNPIPTYIMLLNSNELNGSSLISVRFTPGNGRKAKQLVSSEFESLTPNDPFEFKDFEFNIMADYAITYWSMLKRIFAFFAVITIFIASIGLFGLILFTTKRRVKEIGVRKILGSSVSGIFGQLSGEVLGLLIFAIILASPAAIMLYKGLPGAYKDNLHWWEFLYSIGFVALVAFLTISYHVLKVAKNNPSDALRYE
ncbi:MAG: ABC transporter permease [Prolixibacteraceae bacterium]|nr:ABC transporter permease [Prolixibacteraceae bacterium]MBN2774071.1 ABC transporter permease [Prolixibacteraceae bacterium]